MKNWNVWHTNLDDAQKDDIFYALTMFPYPSGAWLHTWHASVFTINDIVARYMRHAGKTVFNPFWFDSFGLPTENYAMQQWLPAYEVTQQNIEHFIKQVDALQISFDMSNMLSTSDPSYYKWTQRLFLKLYHAWLVYRDELRVNRCPDCQTVLANDQVVDGKCERCKAEILQKKMPQWFIKITAYAERLLEDLDTIDRPEETKVAQRKRIGKSVGAIIDFQCGDQAITVFTTRPDTLFGVTALVLAPENTLLDTQLWEFSESVQTYRQTTLSKTAVERQQHIKDKTWIFSWLYATHPITNERIPVWYADYVLPDYASGAVMFVPAHDERDYAFAEKFWLPITQVILWAKDEKTWLVYEWALTNSWQFDGMDSSTAKDAIIKHIEKIWAGRQTVTYKLRDWSVSRQRYRWSPIPIYYDDEWNPHTVPESELPVLLPLDVKNYKPKWKSPLADHPTFPLYKTSDGMSYQRECDTLDTFMCSSFYFLRFPDVHNDEELIRKELADKLFPVDLYSWWKEHTVGHLLYARFIHKFLYDQWYVSSPEPFKKLIHQGMILWPDGRKMSKRRWNTIDPLDVINKFWSDAVRTYLMFMWPVEQDKIWNDNALKWMKKFLDKIVALIPPLGVLFWANESYLCASEKDQEQAQNEVISLYHQTIEWYHADMEHLKFNTMVSKIMILVNKITEQWVAPKEVLEWLVLFLSPFAPTLAQTMWTQLWRSEPLELYPRPVADASKMIQSTIQFPVQVNWKMRWTIDVLPWLSQDEIVIQAKTLVNVQKYIEWKDVKKIIFVQDKIINFIV